MNSLTKLLIFLMAITFSARCSDGPEKFIPSPNALCSADPLPNKVAEAKKNVISIRAEFSPKDTDIKNGIPPDPIAAHGTAFMVEPGIIVSARHVFMDTVVKLSQAFFPFIIGPDGLPEGIGYNYQFYGNADFDGTAYLFPLRLIGMGQLGQHEDVMILKAEEYPSQLKQLDLGSISDKCESLLSNFEKDIKKIKKECTVYSSGYVPMYSVYPDRFGIYQRALSDIIRCEFKGTIVDISDNMPINKVGVIKRYRILTGYEQGFSGGPLFNEDGQVIGMTIEGSREFTFAISDQDIRKVLNKTKIETP